MIKINLLGASNDGGGGSVLKPLEVTPLATEQEFIPDGFTGYSYVKVKGAAEAGLTEPLTVKSSEQTQEIMPANLGFDKITVEPWILDNIEVKSTLNEQIFTATNDAIKKVTVKAVKAHDLTIDSSTVKQIFTAGEGEWSDIDYFTSIAVNPYELEELVADVSVSDQVFTPTKDGFSKVTISKVTHPNLVPQNIVNGVEIFGVVGDAFPAPSNNFIPVRYLSNENGADIEFEFPLDDILTGFYEIANSGEALGRYAGNMLNFELEIVDSHKGKIAENTYYSNSAITLDLLRTDSGDTDTGIKIVSGKDGNNGTAFPNADEWTEEKRTGMHTYALGVVNTYAQTSNGTPLIHAQMNLYRVKEGNGEQRLYDYNNILSQADLVSSSPAVYACESPFCTGYNLTNIYYDCTQSTPYRLGNLKFFANPATGNPMIRLGVVTMYGYEDNIAPNNYTNAKNNVILLHRWQPGIKISESGEWIFAYRDEVSGHVITNNKSGIPSFNGFNSIPEKYLPLEVQSTEQEQVFTPKSLNATAFSDVLVKANKRTNITIDASVNAVEVNAAEGNYSDIYGFKKVVVSPVTRSIDSNIKPENIREGVTVLGVEGTLVDFSKNTGIPDLEVPFISNQGQPVEYILRDVKPKVNVSYTDYSQSQPMFKYTTITLSDEITAEFNVAYNETKFQKTLSDIVSTTGKVDVYKRGTDDSVSLYQSYPYTIGLVGVEIYPSYSLDASVIFGNGFYENLSAALSTENGFINKQQNYLEFDKYIANITTSRGNIYYGENMLVTRGFNEESFINRLPSLLNPSHSTTVKPYKLFSIENPGKEVRIGKVTIKTGNVLHEIVPVLKADVSLKPGTREINVEYTPCFRNNTTGAYYYPKGTGQPAVPVSPNYYLKDTSGNTAVLENISTQLNEL